MGTPIKIAIADDHIIVREGLCRLIEEFGGYKLVAEADEGKQLLQLLSRLKELPEICILDINMDPGMNGYDTTIELQKKYPSIKILCLSQHDNDFSIIKMIQNGASGYLYKGCRPSELRRALESVYHHGLYSSDLLSLSLVKMVKNQDKDSEMTISDLEMEIISLSCDTEFTFVSIAEKMHLTDRTLESYRAALYMRLGINSREALVLFGVKAGLVSLK